MSPSLPVLFLTVKKINPLALQKFRISNKPQIDTKLLLPIESIKRLETELGFGGGALFAKFLIWARRKSTYVKVR